MKADKAYIFGRRFHHLDLGLILIFIGWILVIHDWFVHERPKVEAPHVHVSIEFEAESWEEREDGTIVIRRRQKEDY